MIVKKNVLLSLGRSMPVFSQAESGGVPRNGIDAQLLSQRVEKVSQESGIACGCQHAMVLVAVEEAPVKRASPTQFTCIFWATPSCKPAADMMILKVKPGANWSWMALFISGWLGC